MKSKGRIGNLRLPIMGLASKTASLPNPKPGWGPASSGRLRKPSTPEWKLYRGPGVRRYRSRTRRSQKLAADPRRLPPDFNLRKTRYGYDIIEEELTMNLSNQSLLVIILVGIVAGYLAGRVMRGGGFGLIGDLIVGLIGAFIGDWLLPQLGIHLGVGIVALIVNAFIGAIVLLLILRLFGGGWGGS